jgi:hypothetical protein
MKEILVEAQKAFNYSPNGWDNARTQVNQELHLREGIVKDLLALDPPWVKLIDESKPIVFSSSDELIEKIIEKDEPKEKQEAPELPIEALLLEDNVEKDENDEKVSTYTFEELEAIVKEAPKGADDIQLGVDFKAVQKSGKWYDVFKEGEKLNEAGISRDNLAKYVYELYLEEA